jgi:glycosyltransferase involved in cell wall biosynthesis
MLDEAVRQASPCLGTVVRCHHEHPTEACRMPKLLMTLPLAARIGGVESYFNNLRRCLTPHGWTVEALGMAPAVVRRQQQLPSYWEHVHTVGHRWWAISDYIEALHESVDRLSPDLVMSFAFEHPLITGPGLPPGPRLVEVVHNQLPPEIERIRRWHRFFDALLAVSSSAWAAIEDGLVGVPAAERPLAQTIPHGIPMPPREGLPPDPPPDCPLRLIWFGRLYRRVKRIFDLIPICDGLVARGLPFHLTVLGDGDDAGPLRDRLREHIDAGRATMKPAVRAERVFGELLGHDVFLSTSEFEGGPLTLVEAMGSGVVPVVTDISGYCRDLVEDDRTGYRVPIGDAAGFVDRIARIAADRPLLARLRAGARLRVEADFDLARMAAETDGFLRRILDRPARRLVDPRDPWFAALRRPSHLAALPGPIRLGVRRVACSVGLMRTIEA